MAIMTDRNTMICSACASQKDKFVLDNELYSWSNEFQNARFERAFSIESAKEAWLLLPKEELENDSVPTS